MTPLYAQPAQSAHGPFDRQQILTKAQRLSAGAYQDPDLQLPKELQELSYDAYRGIRFRPDRALWRGEGLPFEVQFFHRGFLFVDRVRIHEVRNGVADEIPYSPDLFSFDLSKVPLGDSNVGFAGFRLHAPINRSDYYDEVGIFLGASYFRAVARGQVYGLSARGLSIGTADQKGEEFPAFREFWIERPERQSRSMGSPLLAQDADLREAHLNMLSCCTARTPGQVDVDLVVAMAKIEDAESLREATGFLTKPEILAVLNSRDALHRILSKP